MIKSLLCLSTLFTYCVMSSALLHSGELDSQQGARSKALEVELDARLLEMELQMSELRLNDANLEFKKIERHVNTAEEQGGAHAIGELQLELKQAAIRIELRKTQLEMLRHQVKQAGVALDHHAKAPIKKLGKPARVRLNHVKESDVIIVRGKKGDVEKAKALFEDKMPPAKRDTARLEIKIFSIAYGNPSDLASELRHLFPADAPSPIYIASDLRTNSVIVRGGKYELAIVESILLKLDRE